MNEEHITYITYILKIGLLESLLLSVPEGEFFLGSGIFLSCSSVSWISHCSNEAKIFVISDAGWGGGVVFHEGLEGGVSDGGGSENDESKKAI